MKVLVYGSREFGLVVRELVVDCRHEFVGFIDDAGSDAPGVIGSWVDVQAKYPREDYSVAIAVGYKNLAARWGVVSRVRQAGYQLASLVHPTAYIARTAKVGAGAIVMTGANVDINVQLEDACVIWPGCVLSHDCRIGANTFLSPSVTVCGYTVVGRDCFIGASAVVVDHRTVPDASFVKAGSVFK